MIDVSIRTIVGQIGTFDIWAFTIGMKFALKLNGL